mmetsp:Transcript_17376/g.24140  ORF Transcript_17376/g.24140 Transcript_17376/m.24140 type:complete len:154 (+) Transcript_17376:132-593(+)
MLRPKLLPQILQQATSNPSAHVKSAIIITAGGDLLATSSPLTTVNTLEAGVNDKLVGAIAVNIWSTYERHSNLKSNSSNVPSTSISSTQPNENTLHCLLIENEEGRFAITSVSKFLLCIYGDNQAEFGMLKAKVESLRRYLDGPLNELMSEDH